MINIKEFTELVDQAPAGPRLQLGHSSDTLQVISKHANRTICVGSFDGTRDPQDALAGIVQSQPSDHLLQQMFRNNTRVQITKGYLPEVLEKVPAIRWSFVLVDMYHYAPTFDAVMWVWPRMLENGILCCSGWDEKSNLFSAAAIKEVVNVKKKPPDYKGRLAYWKM